MVSNAQTAVIYAVLLLAAPAVAQESQPEPPPSEIVVTGTRDRADQVRDFVGALAPATGGSIPRFIDAVCPQVTGLNPAQNELVTTRLRKVAAGTDVVVAKPGCVPNIFVIVTRDKRAFIEMLSQRQPDAFGQLSAREVRRLARLPGPAAAWQLEGPVNSSNQPLRWDERIGAYVNQTTEGASRIGSVSRRGFDAAALVVEVGALGGLTPIQLADYATMRLLAKLDLSRLPARAPSTILTVLTAPMGTPVPITMTRWDLGFLRGLYSSALNLNPTSQRSQIADGLTRDLEASEATED